MSAFKHVKEKTDNKQQDFKIIAILSNLNNFYSLEVVDRVSEAQLQVGQTFN